MFKQLKNKLKSIKIIYIVWNYMKKKKNTFFGLRIDEQDFINYQSNNLIMLGNKNASWCIKKLSIKDDGLIFSLGIGEDMSFDIELAKKYNKKIIMIDPTPRAILHYNLVMKWFDKEKILTKKFPYNLKGLNRNNFEIVKKAIWNKKKIVKFFLPKNNKNVSHSIINFQNNYSKDTDFIEVDAIRMSDLVNLYKNESKNISLIKMDIEGAEIEVLKDMLSSNIFPKQIAVEFDELNIPTKYGIKRVKDSIDNLKKYNYRLAWASGSSDFLFIRDSEN